MNELKRKISPRLKKYSQIWSKAMKEYRHEMQLVK